MPILTEKTKGTCKYCGQSYSRQGMGRHLKSCKARQMAEPIAGGQQSGRGKVRTAKIYHLFVEAKYIPLYWLHLEMPGDATLQDLDQFLRDIWLECCGHLSMFRVGNIHYEARPYDDFIGPLQPIIPQPDEATLKQVLAEQFGIDVSVLDDFSFSFDRIEERSIDTKLDDALSPGLKFEHEYDFGSTTYLQVRVVDVRTGQVKGEDFVELMARNDPLEITCDVCGKPATELCTNCMWNDPDHMWVCEDCAPDHSCGEDMMLPVVNSPRMGECGYIG